MAASLVYVRENGKVSAEKRFDDMPYNGKRRGSEEVHSVKLLDGEDKLTIDQISAKYPEPKGTENVGDNTNIGPFVG